MAYSRTRAFFRQIRHTYEQHPLLMNSLIGGGVYVIGELIVELQIPRRALGGEEKGLRNAMIKEKAGFVFPRSRIGQAEDNESIEHSSPRKIDWRRVGHIGMLGVVENGVLMLGWFRLLARVVGSNSLTKTVITKCILDQLFFATQQDAIFLGYSGYLRSGGLQAAWANIQQHFLTTWLNDCSLWPLVNFIGFAYVPTALQPSFMSVVQLFWQIYISSVTAGAPVRHAPQQGENIFSLPHLQQALPALRSLVPEVRSAEMKPAVASQSSSMPLLAPIKGMIAYACPAQVSFTAMQEPADINRLQALWNAKVSMAFMSALTLGRLLLVKM